MLLMGKKTKKGKMHLEIKKIRSVDSPCEHNYKVHDVPAIPQVGALMQRKTESQDLYSRLKTENGYEVGLCLFLQGRGDGLKRRKMKEGI